MYEHAPSFGEQVDRFAKNFQTQSEEGLQLCSEAIRDEVGKAFLVHKDNGWLIRAADLQTGEGTGTKSDMGRV